MMLISVFGVSAGASFLDEACKLPDYRSMRASSSNEDLARNGDAKSIAPGETLVLGDLAGPGMITHFWCTLASDDVFVWQSLVFRVYYDGLEEPSVEVPLGDFFGIGWGAEVNYTSEAISVSSQGRARSCFWRMPFTKSAKVTVSNDNPDIKCDSFYYYLDWQKQETAKEDVGYFCARYRQAHPAPPGDHTILETSGRGTYVGTVYSVFQMENGWFGEGDDRFYIDGEETPSLRGTGTEDYFCDAWGFRAFCTPYYGVSLWDDYMAGGRVTAYRWHLPDPVAFQKSLKVSIEHRGSIFTDQAMELGSFIERSDWISSVAFWYQTPPAKSGESIPPLAQRLPPYKILKPGELETRSMPTVLLLKEGRTLTYLPGVTDGWLEMDFETAQDGRYVLQAQLTKAFLGGMYQPMVDGKAVGPVVDFCIPGIDPAWLSLGIHDFKAGKHTLRFENRGNSANVPPSTQPMMGCGLKNLVLLRLQDMQGYQEGLAKALEGKNNAK
jgi:hypothetical protein